MSLDGFFPVFSLSSPKKSMSLSLNQKMLDHTKTYLDVRESVTERRILNMEKSKRK